jgi:hypothetical protein
MLSRSHASAPPSPSPAPRGLLRLPYPDALPRTRPALRQALAAVRGAPTFCARLAVPAERALSRARLLDAVASLDDEQTLHAEPARAGADHQEHDRFFQVARVRGDSGASFMRGLFLAHLEVYEDVCAMGNTLLDEGEWQRLFGGLRSLLQTALEMRLHDGELRTPFPGRSPQWRRELYDPDRRWLVGHRLFFAQTQAVVVGLNLFQHGVASGHERDASDGMRLATAFMQSAAVGMKYTSDFHPVDYDVRARPAMAPPEVQAGFSGLQTRDHAFLVKTFSRLRPLLASADGDALGHRAFVDAYAALAESAGLEPSRFLR